MGKRLLQLGLLLLIASAVGCREGTIGNPGTSASKRKDFIFLRRDDCWKKKNAFSKIQAGLKKRPALINEATSDGFTLLIMAVKNRQPKIANFLIEEGANLNAALKPESAMEGKTALHWAALSGYSELVDILIRAGAEVDPKDDMDDTPLHEAAYRGHLDSAKLLLPAGASVNSRSEHGYTPLMWCVAGMSSGKIDGEHAEVIKLLLQHGADPTLRAKYGLALSFFAEDNSNVWNSVTQIISETLVDKLYSDKGALATHTAKESREEGEGGHEVPAKAKSTDENLDLNASQRQHLDKLYRRPRWLFRTMGETREKVQMLNDRDGTYDWTFARDGVVGTYVVYRWRSDR